MVDSGGGLERLCCAAQGVLSVFDTDMLQPLLHAVTRWLHSAESFRVHAPPAPASTRSSQSDRGSNRDGSDAHIDDLTGVEGKGYRSESQRGPNEDDREGAEEGDEGNNLSSILPVGGVADPEDAYGPLARVLTDHLRTAIALAAAGVRPSPRGAGYIIRRLIRRALTHLWAYTSEEMRLEELIAELKGDDGAWGCVLAAVQSIPASSSHHSIIHHQSALAPSPLLGVAHEEDGWGATPTAPPFQPRLEAALKTIRSEEAAYRSAVRRGFARLDSMLSHRRAAGESCVSRAELVQLYESQGLPMFLAERRAADVAGFSICN
eukprot:GHVU01086275.1.p1 GENE.GHVU01086275.1~~GHVU01086275.1.p1  ORF type:complete len:321 (+),score=40.53 GHVU01086275.1:1454-2416(+)